MLMRNILKFRSILLFHEPAITMECRTACADPEHFSGGGMLGGWVGVLPCLFEFAREFRGLFLVIL